MGRGDLWGVWPFPSPEEHVHSAELGAGLCSFPERFPLPLAGFPIRRRNRFPLRSVPSRRPTRRSAATPRSSSSSSRASWLRRQSTRYWSALSPVAARTEGAPQGVKKVLLGCVSHGHQPLTAHRLSYLHVVALPSLLSMRHPKHPGWGGPWRPSRSRLPAAFQVNGRVVLCNGFHQGSALCTRVGLFTLGGQGRRWTSVLEMVPLANLCPLRNALSGL